MSVNSKVILDNNKNLIKQLRKKYVHYTNLPTSQFNNRYIIRNVSYIVTSIEVIPIFLKQSCGNTTLK